MAQPVKLDSFCGEENGVHHYPRLTSMGSILTSVYDELPAPESAPSLQQYRRGLRTTRGAVAHYAALRLLKPNIAKALGENGDYLFASEAIFTNEITPDGRRYVYLYLRDHGNMRWQALRAADTQNVCSEGERLS